MIAILENYQQADGSIVVPEALRAMGGQRSHYPRDRSALAATSSPSGMLC